MTTPLIERYREFLPVGPATPVVSLGEGYTPLIPLPRLSARFDIEVHATPQHLTIRLTHATTERTIEAPGS